MFSDVKVNTGTMLDECVVFPQVVVGRDCWIRKAIIDSGCQIPDGTVIGEDAEDDARRFHVTRGGVVLVTLEMLGQRTRQFG